MNFNEQFTHCSAEGYYIFTCRVICPGLDRKYNKSGILLTVVYLADRYLNDKKNCEKLCLALDIMSRTHDILSRARDTISRVYDKPL